MSKLEAIVPLGMSEAESKRLMVAVYAISDIVRPYTLAEQEIIVEVFVQAFQQVQRDYAGAPAGVPLQ